MASKKRSKKDDVKTFTVRFSLTGHGEAQVEATSEAEARELLMKGMALSERCLEWEYDEINSVEEER